MQAVTIQTQVFKFSELSQDAQEKAISNLWDINVSHNWWEFTYDDAKNVGVKILSFDIERGEIDIRAGRLTHVASQICQEHGETTTTYTLASEFLSRYDELEARYTGEYENDKEIEALIEDLENEFFSDLEYEFSQMLKNEFEYLTSTDAIIETIEANEYEFDEDGNLF